MLLLLDVFLFAKLLQPLLKGELIVLHLYVHVGFQGGTLGLSRPI